MSNKTQSLHIRLTADENAAFKKLSENIGEVRSRVARKLLREAINNEIDLLTDEALMLKVAIRQLIGMANNLNQITKAINSGQTLSQIDQHQLRDVVQGTIAARDEIINIILKTKKRWVNNHEQ